MCAAVVIPLNSLSDKTILPQFVRESDGKFIYSLHAPIDGDSIHRNSKTMPLFFEMIIPIGIACYLKSIHFETNGIYCQDLRFKYGLQKLKEGVYSYDTSHTEANGTN